MPESSTGLPNASDWRFDEIAAQEPERASALENAASADELTNALATAFDVAVGNGALRLGWEEAELDPLASRVVAQFHVTKTLFDWFFNARTGYRAHFRVNANCGLAFNARLVTVLRERLDHARPIQARHLAARLIADKGPITISRSCLQASLVPELSKIWFCTRVMNPDGTISDTDWGVTGPRLRLGIDTQWAAPYRDNPNEARLELKGAFLGQAGPFQPKDPSVRAQHLHAHGDA